MLIKNQGLIFSVSLTHGLIYLRNEVCKPSKQLGGFIFCCGCINQIILANQMSSQLFELHGYAPYWWILTILSLKSHEVPILRHLIVPSQVRFRLKIQNIWLPSWQINILAFSYPMLVPVPCYSIKFCINQM